MGGWDGAEEMHGFDEEKNTFEREISSLELVENIFEGDITGAADENEFLGDPGKTLEGS